MLPSIRSHHELYRSFTFKERSFHLNVLISGTPLASLSKIARFRFQADVTLLVVYACASESIHHDVRGRTAVIIPGHRSFRGEYEKGKAVLTNEDVPGLWVYMPGKVCESFLEEELSPFHAIPNTMDCVLVCAG